MAEFVFGGVYTALVTPFVEDGSTIDWSAFDKLVEAQLEGGVTGLVPCGTTGETPTLSAAEQREVVARCRQVAGADVPLLVGTGSNSTRHSIDVSRAAIDAGADAVMIVMPYYNKPSQDGMRRHVELIAREITVPIVLYNIPGRCGVELQVDTLLAILESCPNVVGVKDATGNVQHCQSLLRQSGERVVVMSGDDPLTLPMMSVGAKGVVSVTSNLYPRQIGAVVEAVVQGHWEVARARHFALLPVHQALFCEPNPQPIKAALAARGRMTAAVRPPLIAAGEACRQRVVQAMSQYEAR